MSDLPLDYQLQTLGRAESKNRQELVDAAERLNAQNVQIYKVERWVMTCNPQPQDCGPLPEEDR